MRRLLRLWLISTLLACTIALSAAPGNVILILCNGVNLAQLELARQAGIRRAGLSGMAALPSAGTLLPLTGRYRSQQISALNALASGYAGDTTLGVTSSGDELESLLGEARLQGRRTGFITDGALNDWPGGAFFARENPLPRLDRIEAWLPLCDIDFLGGALVRSKPVTLEPLEMPMSRLGYQLARTPGELRAASAGRRLFATHDPAAEPSALLSYMDTALRLLPGKNGMFLVADCSRPARAAAVNDTAGVIRELWRFDRVLCRALDFFKAAPGRTLIVVVSLYDIGDLQLPRPVSQDFPVGLTRPEILERLSAGRLSGRDALKLAGAGELFAPNSRELAAVLDSYSRLAESPLPRSFAPWLDRLLHQRDRHEGVEWLTRTVTISLTPVFAIGVGAKEYEGEYNALELHEKLRGSLGIGKRP